MDGVFAGRYRLLNRLGAGGMSVVWRAHDDVLDREVAVKILATEQAADPGLPDRVRIEARTAARLRHPNVVEVYDYGETDDHRPYVVMELIDGRSLAEVLRGGALPWRTAALVGVQVAAALAAAHARGIVHRDVKPSNVMVTADGVKLVDFGISATVGEADGTGAEVLGTPAYLAPERLRGGPVRPATDVYALGLLLYLALVGRLPWQASTTTEMLRAHRYLEPSVLPPVTGLPPEVAELCHRCLAKDPVDRPGAEEVARLLAEFAGLAPAPPLLGGTAGGTAEDAAATTVLAAVRRRRRPLVAAAGTALLIVASLLWFRLGPDDTTVAAAPAVAAPPPTNVGCTVDYTIRSAGNGRFSTAVTIANSGTGAAPDWQLTFVLPAGQRLVRGWSGSWVQDGQSLHLRGAGLPAGGQVSTGFDASYRGRARMPSQFRLNDTICRAQTSASQETASTPATTTTAAGGRTVTTNPAGSARSGSESSKAKTTSKKSKGKGKSKDKDKDKAKGKAKGKDK